MRKIRVRTHLRRTRQGRTIVNKHQRQIKSPQSIKSPPKKPKTVKCNQCGTKFIQEGDLKYSRECKKCNDERLQSLSHLGERTTPYPGWEQDYFTKKELEALEKEAKNLAGMSLFGDPESSEKKFNQRYEEFKKMMIQEKFDEVYKRK